MIQITKVNKSVSNAFIKPSSGVSPIQQPYVIDPIFPNEHKVMIVNVEGGGKTTQVCGVAVHVAAGVPFLAMDVLQSPVLMIDEETPPETLELKLNRFALGLGISSYTTLPINVLSKEGFRFGSKTALDNVIKPAIKATLKLVSNPTHILITLDSLISMLGATSHSSNENNDGIGRVVGDTLEQIQSFCRNELGIKCSIIVTVHARKHVVYFDIDDIKQNEIQTMVRGHGGIIGLGCDTGWVLKKISEKPILRGVLIPKPRRLAIPVEEIYWEMQEEEYGKGWARLEKIQPVPIPPSELAVKLFSLFYNSLGKPYSAKELNSEMGMESPDERRLARSQLEKHKIIINSPAHPFTYKFNPDFMDLNKQGEVHFDYACQLLAEFIDKGGKIS